MSEKMKRQTAANHVNDKIARKFVSGDTVPLGERKSDWEELKIHEEEPRADSFLQPELSPIVWYDRSLMKKSEDLFRELHKLHVIETYKYVVTYLLDYFGIHLSQEGKRAYFSYIKEADLRQIAPMDVRRAGDFWKNPGAWEQPEAFEELTSYLSLMVKDKFLYNKYPEFEEEDDWQIYFEQLIRKFSYEKLRDLALALEIPTREVTMFMRKVLKRTGFNFYSADEVYLYLVLKYGRSREYFSQYVLLKEMYDPDHRAPVGAELGRKDDKKIHTRELGRELDLRMEEIRKELQDDKQLFLVKNPRLTEFFGWIGSFRRQKKMRTSEEMIREKLEQLRKTIAGSYDYSIYCKDEAFRKYKDTYMNRNAKEVTVWYETGKEIKIPVGMPLTCDVKINKIIEKARFAVDAPEDGAAFVKLPEKDYDIVPVKVACLESGAKVLELATKKKWRSSNIPQFVKPNHLTEGFQVEDERYRSAVKEIQVGSKVRFESDSKAEPGTIFVTCPCGMCIEAGTRFFFEEEGVRFTYEAAEHANVVVREIAVRPLTVLTAEEKKAWTFGEKVKAKQPLFVDEPGAGVEGVWEVSSGKTGKLSHFAGKGKGNSVEVVCSYTCRIPQGTIFYRYEGGRRLEYEVIEEFVQKPLAQTTLNIVWQNSEELWKMKDKDRDSSFEQGIEKTIVESDTELNLEIEGVDRVYTPKRMIAYPKMEEYDLWREANKRVEERRKEAGGTVVSNNSMVEYLYDAPNSAPKDYQGIRSEGEDFFLNTTLFRETRLTNNTLSVLPDGDERRRNMILTLLFLDFILQLEEHEEIEEDDELFLEADKPMDVSEKVLEMFVQIADQAMEKCGFQTINGGNPYDAFLAMLLFCDDPMVMFQDLWSERHPFSDYLILQWPERKEKEEIEAELFDENRVRMASWNISDTRDVYSMPYLEKRTGYCLKLRCFEKAGRGKRKECWSGEAALILSDTRETLVEVRQIAKKS